MFTLEDEKAFRKAIQEKDILYLKVSVVDAMRSDPTFVRGEVDKVLKILDEEMPEIYEEYKKFDYEDELAKKDWDKQYFTKLTYRFQKNFAKSRIPYIKEVGQAVHQDTARNYAESMKIGTSSVNEKKTTKAKTNPPKAPAAKVRKISVVGVIAAAATLVLVVVLLIKLFNR